MLLLSKGKPRHSISWNKFLSQKWCSNREENFRIKIFIKEHSISFLMNNRIFFYSLNEKSYTIQRKKNSTPDYQEKFKILCHPLINAFNIDKYLFWMPFLIMDKTTFIRFGLISSSNIRVLKKKWIHGIDVEYIIILNKDLTYIWKSTREPYIYFRTII